MYPPGVPVADHQVILRNLTNLFQQKLRSIKFLV